MKATLKKLEDCKVELTVEVDEDLWKKSLADAKRKLAANLSIKGFRKGHVPPAMADRYLDPQRIAQEAINLVINPAYQAGLRETKVYPYDQATPEILELKDNGPVIKYTFTEAPHAKLGKVAGFTAEHPVASVTEEEISADINARLAKAADLTSVDREAKLGDTVVIDFVGYVDGKAFDGGTADNYELELGSNSFVPGFEDAVVGMKTDDEKDINITFPEQYVEELAGKPATFHVKLHEVKEKVIPTLSDEAVLDLAIRDVKTVDELKEFVRKDLLQRKVNQIEQTYLNAILEQIEAEAEVEYPSIMLQQQAEKMVSDTKTQVENNGLTFEQFLQITGDDEASFLEKQKVIAAKDLKRFIVVDQICLENRLNPTKDEVEAELDRQAANYNIDKATLRRYYGDNLDRLANDIRSAKLTRFLLEKNPYAAPAAKEEPKAEEKPAEEEKPVEEAKPAKPKATRKKKAEVPAEGEEGK